MITVIIIKEKNIRYGEIAYISLEGESPQGFLRDQNP